ncbi:3'-5' exonuclease [Campylobacter sp. MG1]|uniref:3'-5' exonuclease n=1 Tax=Campylobacter sp. MG1 TaxID=2976332 RepID=UPI00226D0F3C|nr:3'-5' exonuclease [Campylobacter sp. MG1]
MKYILFDTETTGNGEQDRIIQVGALVYDSEKYTKNIEEYCENLFDNIKEKNVLVFDELCKSDVEISYEAMEVHNITPDMIKNKPYFLDTEFANFLEKHNVNDNYLIAHNIKFDLGMLEKEGFKNNYKLIDTYKCARAIFPNITAHRLQYLRYFLELYKYEKDEANNIGVSIKAHNAIGDVLIMKLLLDKLLVNNTYDDLCEITKKPLLLDKFPFGKHKGKSIEEVCTKEPQYISWFLNNISDEDLIYSIKYIQNNT